MQLDYAAERPEEEIWEGQIEFNDYMAAGGVAEDFYQAEVEEPWQETQSLDAIQRKGGKGKGKKGKGSKGKGKGGKSGKGNTETWLQSKQCYNCGEWGHIAQSNGEWSCPKPDKRLLGKGGTLKNQRLLNPRQSLQ